MSLGLVFTVASIGKAALDGLGDLGSASGALTGDVGRTAS